MKSAASARRAFPASAAGKGPPRSMPPARRSEHSDYWPLRLSFRCWWKAVWLLPSSARRLPGSSFRWRPGLFGAPCDPSGGEPLKEPAARRVREAATADRANVSGRSRSLGVDAFAKRHRVELGVCRLLLVQVCREKAHDLVVAEFFGPSDQRPITADFVVLHGLGVRDDGGVQHGLVLDLACRLVGFLDDAVDRRTLRTGGLFAKLAEHVVEPLDLLVGLFQMGFQPRDEVPVGGLIDHLGERFEDLLLRIVDVLQTMNEQVLHRFYVLRKIPIFDLSFCNDDNGTPLAGGGSLQ